MYSWYDEYYTLTSNCQITNFFRKTKPDVPPEYNEIDGKVDRRSFCGKYSIEDNGVPRYI